MDKGDKIIRVIKKHIMFDDFEGAVQKSLWRMSGGNREKAYKIVRECTMRYGFTNAEVTDQLIDIALGELNGGVEIEWAS